MEWAEYVENIVKKEKYLDNIRVEVNGIEGNLPIIIKASVYMLEKMIKNQGKYNIFVFPDGELSLFLFMFSKLIYNIIIGKIDKIYDPESFTPGQKLKLKNAVVEFVKVDYEHDFNGQKAIYVKNSEYTNILKLEYAPFFQKVDTAKRLSSGKVYEKAKKEIAEELKLHNNYLKKIVEMKTYMQDSIYYVASVTKCKEMANTIKIDQKSIYDIVLTGQTNYQGKVEVKGKFSGTPAIIFASQIAYVVEAIRSGAKCQSVIINLTECDINNQLPELDKLKTYDVPIVCVTDTMNSFDLSEIEKRGFNTWRWDEDSITSELYEADNVVSSKRTELCVKENIIFDQVSSQYIDEAFSRLYKYRKTIETESRGMNRIFSVLFSMSYFALRNIRVISAFEREKSNSELESCRTILEVERNYITEEIYNDFSKAIECLSEVLKQDFVFPKYQKTIDILKECEGKKVCLICSNNDNPNEIKNCLLGVLPEYVYNFRLKVCSIKDYHKYRECDFDLILMTGWFSGASVRKVIYGYDTKEVHVLIYKNENAWKKAHSKSWERSLNNQNNKVIVQKSFAKNLKNKEILIQTESLAELTSKEKAVIKEQDNLDYILQENRFRQYCAKGKDADEIVEAKPVSYVGGSFSLFRKGHKVIVCTKIIQQITNKIEETDVENLCIGDFIVVREASKDLIREVADIILEHNNLHGLRDLSEIWQEALKIEHSFSTVEEIEDRLKKEGCSRSTQTIRNWILNDEIIIPQDIEDLKAIARVTQDSVLTERLNDIFEAGLMIKKAHIKAGKILSERLTDSIASIIRDKKIVDTFNVWDPIELTIDGVGPVKILKIIDIGQSWLPVNYNDTNKVLAEEKGESIWQE